MKTRLIALSLLVIFTASVISGCASVSAMQLSTPTQHPSKAETADVVRTLNEPNPEKETAPEAVTPRITVPETDTIEVQQNESKSAPATPADQTHLSSGYLTQEEAIAIALNDAGLLEEQVIYRRVELDVENGQPVYEIEFYSGTTEYDYEIHAESGKIISRESEVEKKPETPSTEPSATEPPATEPPATEPPATEPPATEPEVARLSKEQVYAIALKHAGLSKDQVSRLKAEFDYDDGRPEYDVEFKYDGWEYEYEIHAESGKILRSHKERDDDTPPATEPPATEPPATEPPATEPPATEPEATRLSKEQVYAIALKHAGLSKDQVSRLKAEFDYDDGRPEYDVEFKYDGWEYEYEIHAESGEILKWDKDRDD